MFVQWGCLGMVAAATAVAIGFAVAVTARLVNFGRYLLDVQCRVRWKASKTTLELLVDWQPFYFLKGELFIGVLAGEPE